MADQQADDEHLLVWHFDEFDDDTLVDPQLVDASRVLVGNLLAVAAFPEITIAVFHHLVVVPVAAAGRIAVGNLLQDITFYGVEPSA